ncbi:Spy/CpxP family protein refolding chaperone [Microbulbifer sp. THAF38]|uniref:Spy/CpxP family protein refolding chaperone n=1 Tax=Microbulbifer sp. THAF38 TaxID=2587856 RepID=UPI001268857D|nr:Spy/CpxP family protein refolding chaperone [Microbulbifer sp. THAF38]QFT54158.1 periplasmic repressor CpxP [Microbulbifer sp. THAF38]
MKNWKLMLSSLALAGVMAAPAATMAFGAEGGHHKRGFEHMARKLELTEGQKAQLKANRDSNSESRNAQRQQLQELRKEIYTALESGADQATLDQLGAELGKLQVQKMQNHFQMRQQFEAILTDEQKAKFEELKEQRKERRVKWREERLERRTTES